MKKTWNIITSILAGTILLLALLLVGPKLIGYETYIVLSGSMEPVYHTGSIIYVQDVEQDELEVGDVITFHRGNVIVTHRIKEIKNEEYITKGDANEDIDASSVSYNEVIGKPVFSIPLLGYVTVFIQQPPGLYISVALGCGLVLLIFIGELLFKDTGEIN